MKNKYICVHCVLSQNICNNTEVNDLIKLIKVCCKAVQYIGNFNTILADDSSMAKPVV